MKSSLNVCFLGLGSIGSRHIRNLITVGSELGLDFQIDALKKTKNPIADDIKKYLNRIFTSNDEIKQLYDIVFITNPTSLHFETIRLMADKASNMFIEKPIFDKIDYDINNLQLSPTSMYYIACPLRYSGIVQELKKIIPNENIYAIRAICSSYLPEWRKGVDYRKVYSAKKLMGGGVSIDLIHEWDYLTHLFGFPQEVINLQGKYSHLEIDSEDLSVYIARYKDKLAELHLDYFGRTPKREIELFTYNGTITGNFIQKEIYFSNGNPTINVSGYEDVYILEMRNFLQMILKNTPNNNDIKNALNVMKLTKC